MNCRVCGSQLRPDARSCVECGSAVLLTHSLESDATATARIELAPDTVNERAASATSDQLDTPDDASVSEPRATSMMAAPVVQPSKPRAANVAARPKRSPSKATGSTALLHLAPAPSAAVEAVPIEEVELVAAPETQRPDPEPRPDSRPPFVPPTLLAPITTLAEGADETRIVIRSPRVRFKLTFTNGEEHHILGHSLLGRRPKPQPGEEQPRLITISDPERSVSKTHLELGIDNGNLWIADRWSSNGTVLVTPHGTGRVCDPGRRYELEAGNTVEIGDVIFTVTAL